MKQSRTSTRGNVIVEDIKVGDIHWEYSGGSGIKVEVITKPEFDGDIWSWKSKIIEGGTLGYVIDFGVHPNYPHYSSKLYDYEAYTKL